MSLDAATQGYSVTGRGLFTESNLFEIDVPLDSSQDGVPDCSLISQLNDRFPLCVQNLHKQCI